MKLFSLFLWSLSFLIFPSRSLFSIFISLFFFSLHRKCCFPEFHFGSIIILHTIHSLDFPIQTHDFSWWLLAIVPSRIFPWAPDPIWKDLQDDWLSGKSKLLTNMITFIYRKTKVYVCIENEDCWKGDNKLLTEISSGAEWVLVEDRGKGRYSCYSAYIFALFESFTKRTYLYIVYLM